MKADERAQLLADLHFDSGQAEATTNSQARKSFLPVTEHLRVFDPSVVLIVGDRGAGKTGLMKAVNDPELRRTLASHARSLHLDEGTTEWRTAFPLNRGGPDAQGWLALAQNQISTPEALLDAWFMYLSRVLFDLLDPEGRQHLSPLIDLQGGDAERGLEVFRRIRSGVLLALDRLDAALEQRNAWVFLTYDELDTIVLGNWEIMGTLIRALVSFWTIYTRRWRRIRAKLFLRTDFYQRHHNIVGADIAKLAANRVELSWSDKNLYAMLIKGIANCSPALCAYVERSVSLATDPVLGLIPQVSTLEQTRPFIERMVGSFMGANEKKGAAFTWILNSVRDGNGKIAPRSLVQLLEFAARQEEQEPRAVGNRLLHHVSLRQALDRVSGVHVQQAITHEFPWLEGVKRRVAAERQVPWERRTVERLLTTDWDGSWNRDAAAFIGVPAQNARELVDYLIQVGIMRSRGGKVDVPDLYLRGLDLRRKGGVAKK